MSEPEYKPMSLAKQEEILAMKSLAEVLPYKFQNGCTVDGIASKCSKCGEDIDVDNIRGEITHSNIHSISMSAYALCFHCRLATPLEMRFDDEGGCLAKGPNGWVKTQFTEQKPAGWFNRLMSLFNPGGLR